MNKTRCINSNPVKKKPKARTRLFSKQGPFGLWLDDLFRPIMLWLQDNTAEEPQRTHPWNWTRIPNETARLRLGRDQMAPVAADPKACKRYWFPYPKFHMPRFGGWNQYVVLTPARGTQKWIPGETWYIGWIGDEGEACVSRVPLTTPVRMLRGPTKTKFFALDRHHRQIGVFTSDFGETGKASPEHAILPQL